MLRDHSRVPWAESSCALKYVRPGDACSAPGGEDYFYVRCMSTLGVCVPGAWGHTVDTQHVLDE